ncbi:putative RNA binding protein [Candida maltosa Xu316]|uniref:Putative RNA binding protein n=1 Tax=Candida maltosa (strain Xu316) TaxID=1245528 RepID=M3HK71_CANMX|nr:putative RNA binding protein [Candida maltosa Xu316]
MQNTTTTSSKPTSTSTTPGWNPNHFRLFVGNLGPDVDDELLRTSFGKFASMSQAHVPIDHKTNENKGFGFVAFSKSEDYLKAFQEMNGKYIGQKPVQLKRAESTAPNKKNRKNRKK